MLSQLTRCARNLWARLSSAASQFFRRLTEPARPNLVTGTLADVPRSRAERLAENALLRQQLIVLHRNTKTPRLTWPERFMLVTGELQLIRVLKEYVAYFNPARPHQGIAQQLPAPTVSPPGEANAGMVMAFPVLNGLHHDYRRAAA